MSRYSWNRSLVTQEFQEVDSEKGEYLCFSAIALKQGWLHDPEGTTLRAKNFCESCCRMGGKWVSYNEQTLSPALMTVIRHNGGFGHWAAPLDPPILLFTL